MPDWTKIKIPAVDRHQKLQAVDYCTGCPRFLPSVGAEKERNPAAYGRCLRSGEIDGDEMEVWRLVPAGATVGQCWYHLSGKR